jgi:hypothetical protein
MLNGIINLLPLNKKFLAVSFCFWGAGGIMPFSNVFAGFTLLAGFANGLRQDLKKHFDAKIDESTSAINGKIDESTKEIRKDIEGVNGKVALLFMQNAATLVEIASIKAGVRGVQGSLDETRKEILDQVHREGAAVADNVTSNVNTHVDKKLVELFAQISGLTKQCVDLSNGVSKVGHGNTVVAEAMKELENKLLKMREDFSSVLAESIAKMDASTKESTEMLKKMGLMGEAQDAKIASLIAEVTNNNQLLSSLSKIQSESGKALTSLQENSAANSDLLQKLFARQESSDLHFGEKISSLHQQNEIFKTSLNASLDILSQRVGTLERGQIEIKSLVELNARNQEQQFQLSQTLLVEVFQLKQLVGEKTARIESLEDLVQKLLKKFSKIKKDVKETRKNTEENTEHLIAIRYQSGYQRPRLSEEEQANIDRGWAVPIHSFNQRLNESPLPLDLNKFKKTGRKPTPALTYNPVAPR